MVRLLRSAYVIGRRDFAATVFSKTFLLFLLGPLLIIVVASLMGHTTGQMAREDLRSRVAVVAAQDEFEEIQAARARLDAALAQEELPEFVHVQPASDPQGQVKALLA